MEETSKYINTEYTKNINQKAEDGLIKPISYENTSQYSLMYSYNMISYKYIFNEDNEYIHSKSYEYIHL